MSALSASNVEEVHNILQALEEEMLFEDNEEDYASLCEGIDFDTELIEGKDNEEAPILLPFKSNEKKRKEGEENDSLPLMCGKVSSSETDILTDCGLDKEGITNVSMDDYIDDSIFNMLFNECDLDIMPREEIEHIVQATNNSLADDAAYKPMSSQEMATFIQGLFSDVTGEQDYEATTCDNKVCSC